MRLDVKEFGEGASEPRNKLGASVGGGVMRNTMFGEDMDDAELSEIFGRTGGVRGDEDALLGELVYNDEDRVVTVRKGECFDEVHGDRVLGAFSDRGKQEVPLQWL